MSAPETVEVRITATQRVRYRIRRRIPKAEFDEYEAMCARSARDREYSKTFGYLIDDADDDSSSEDYDDLEIELISEPAQP